MSQFENRNALSRRRFLQVAGMGMAGVVAAACARQVTPTAAPAAPTTAGRPAPAPQPTTAQPAAPATQQPVAQPTVAPTAAPPTAAPPKPAEVRFQDWGGDFGKMVEEVAIPRFQEEFPHIKVGYEPYASGWEATTLAAMVAGTAPDIIHAWTTVVRPFADRGQLIDLNPLVERDLTAADIDDFYGFQWKGLVLPGTNFRHMMPKHIFVLMVEYNKDAFDEAGVPYPTKDWDHDDYQQVLAAMTKRASDGSVERFGGYIPASGTGERLWSHVASFGGGFADMNDRTKCLMGTPESQAAFEWVRARMWDENTLIQSLQLEGRGEHDVFVDKTCAMVEGITTHLHRVVKDTDFAWDMTWLPKGPAKRTGFAGANGWGVYKGVETRGNKEGVWEFLKFATGPVFQEMQLIPTSRTPIPARRSLYTKFVEINRERLPELNDVNLEGLYDMMIEPGFLEADPGTFAKHAAALEIITPALEQVYITGTAPVSLLGEICSQIEREQS
jgi:multiple sugar transport system substrate-binding protein